MRINKSQLERDLKSAIEIGINAYRIDGSICSASQIMLFLYETEKYASLASCTPTLATVEAAMIEVFERDAADDMTSRFVEVPRAHFTSRRWRYEVAVAGTPSSGSLRARIDK